MICTAYLHEYAILDQFTESTYHLMADIIDNQKRIISCETLYEEKVFLNDPDAENYLLIVEDTRKGVVTKIGETVIEIFKAFSEMITNICKSIGENIKRLRKASSDETLKKQMEENPELAKKFIDSVMSGNIKIHDVKDMNELLETAQKISGELMSGKMDEKTFSEKMDSALDKYAGRARSITAIFGLVTSGAAAATAVGKIVSKSTQYDEELVKARTKMNAIKETAMNCAKDEANGKGNRLSIFASYSRKLMAELGKDGTAVGRLCDKLWSAVGSVSGKVTTKYGKNAANNKSTKYNDRVDADKSRADASDQASATANARAQEIGRYNGRVATGQVNP